MGVRLAVACQAGDLPAVLRKAHRAIKPQGVLYASFKFGSFEGMRKGRWFTDLNEEGIAELTGDDFDIERIWVTEDVRPEKKGEKWLNCLLRKRS